MAEVDGLLVRVEASTSQLRSELDRAVRSVDRTASSIEKQAGRAERAVTAIGHGLKGALAGIAAGTVAADVLRTVVQFEKLDARIARLTGTQQAFADAQKYLSRTADDLGVEIATLTGSYAGLLSLQQGGKITQEQGRQLLEGLTDASAALGAETAQLGQVFFGLQQSLGSASVTLEDVRQVTDPLPGLFDKIAQAAGKSSGAFKQMISDGKVSSQTFASLLITALEEYQGAAAEMAETVGGSWVRLGNAWTELKRTLEEPISDVLTPLLDVATRTINRLRALTSDDLDIQIRALKDQIATAEATPQPLRGIMLGAQAQFGGYGSLAEMRQELAKLERFRAMHEERGGVEAPISGDPPAQPAKPGGVGGGAGDEDDKGKKKFDSVIADLKAERAELGMTSKERFVSSQLRKLDATATDEQRAAVRALAETYYVEKSAKDAARLASERAAEVAAKDDEARAKAVERGKEILEDKRELTRALDDELVLAQKALEMSALTERARRIETRLLQEEIAWREKGIPLTEKELEQKRAVIAAIVDTEMATEANAAAMQYLEQFGSRAFDRIGSAITEMAMQGKADFADLKNVGLAIVSELMQEFILLAAINPLKNAIFGADPTRQTLGSLFSGFAEGGRVAGPGSGTSDSIPAMLSNGEYVVNARATSQHLPLLEAINGGRVPRFADGGLVAATPIMPRVPELRPAGGGGEAPAGDTYYIDNRGADAAAVARLEASLRALNGSVEHRAVKAVFDDRRRSPANWR